MYKLFKFLITSITLVFAVISAQSQSSLLLNYSLSIEPTIGNRLISYKGNYPQSFKDSIKKADRSRDAISMAFMVSTKFKSKNRFYIGLQFQNFGFTRKKDNLRFLDTIHPEIGIMNDLSQTGGAYVDFNYRYNYLAIPLLFSKQISSKKKTSTIVHFIYGGSLSALIKHDIRAVLHGFSTRGNQKVYTFKNPAENVDRINVNLQAGLRIETMLYNKSTWVFVQPEIFIPTLNANSSNERHRLWALGLQVGVYYVPQFKEDKK
jgi:uncharacterized membrane protein